MSRLSVPSDLHVAGIISCNGLNVPNNAVKDASVDSTSPITAPKLQHQHQICWGQARGASPTANTGETIYVAYGAGTIVSFGAGFNVDESGWSGNVTVDLRKNGSTVLSGVITLNSSTVVTDVSPAGIASASYAADDVFEVVTTYTAGAGTPPQGVFCRLVVREAAAP